ncbi:MAG: homogentisate 1,2-dioxygenase [Bacteriovoracaceae bacterium]
MDSFKSSGTVTKQAHVDIPDGLYEEEHGRNGFFGRVSQIYHENPPVNWTHIEGNLKPRLLPSLFNEESIQNSFAEVLKNNDTVLSLAHYKEDFKNFFRNADFDELYFIHDGEGTIETLFGHVPYKKGDYIVIPRGTTYKLYLKTPSKILKVESASEFEQPERGMLGPNALYDQTALFVPSSSSGSEQDKDNYIVEIKRLGDISKVHYPFNPLDGKGWKGNLYPYKLSIYDICPIMSHRYHIPPSGHTTFVCRNFVVCSFVERPLEDSKHKVLKVPFYHSNIDFDEVLFYHQGDFFSRDNIDPGNITFHPQGIHHGPHPNAFKNTMDKEYTDEYAVMIDTKNPLIPTKLFEKFENPEYWKSWSANEP